MTDSVQIDEVQVVVSNDNPVSVLSADTYYSTVQVVPPETSVVTTSSLTIQISPVLSPDIQLVVEEMDVVTVDATHQVVEVTAETDPATQVIIPREALVIQNGVGGSHFVVSLLDIGVTTSYYGGLVDNSTWKINKWVASALSVATQSNNPGVSMLSSAWTSRNSLVYS